MTVELRLVLDDDQLAEIAAAVAENIRPDDRSQPAPQAAYLSVAAAADDLGVSEERVRKLIQRRGIPYFQEGPGCRVTLGRADLDAWMAHFRHRPREAGA